MSKQSEIRDGIRRDLTFAVEDTEYWEIGNHFALKGKAITKLLDYLHSKGCVLKVDRESPEDWYNDGGNKLMIKEELAKAGYVATESIVEG